MNEIFEVITIYNDNTEVVEHTEKLEEVTRACVLGAKYFSTSNIKRVDVFVYVPYMGRNFWRSFHGE